MGPIMARRRLVSQQPTHATVLVCLKSVIDTTFLSPSFIDAGSTRRSITHSSAVSVQPTRGPNLGPSPLKSQSPGGKTACENGLLPSQGGEKV